MAKKFISVLLIISIILPLSISLVHSFHNHDSSICYAKTENHIHPEKADCDQLHYFIQTLNHSDVEKIASIKAYWSRMDQGVYTSLFIINLEETDPDRGPPFFSIL